MNGEIFAIRLRLFITATLAAAFSSMAQAEPFFAQRVLQEVTFQVESPSPKDGKTVYEELVALPWNAADTYDAILRGEANEQQLLAETGHPNTYTLTKCIAEHLLVERSHFLNRSL